MYSSVRLKRYDVTFGMNTTEISRKTPKSCSKQASSQFSPLMIAITQKNKTKYLLQQFY